MRVTRAAWTWLAVLALAAVPGSAQSTPCDGPSSTSEVISCSQAVTPQNAARAFLESALLDAAAPTPTDLAAALEARAYAVCTQPPEKNTIGPLYGLGQWGCENGYSWRKLCDDNSYFEKEVDAAYGYVIVYHVVVSSDDWNVFPLDTSVGTTLKRTAAGDVTLSVILSLRAKTSSTIAPADYVATLQNQYRGQATVLKKEILDYCDQYKRAYCAELQSLALRLTRPPSGTSGAAPIQLAIAVAAEKHVSSTTSLPLTSDAVRLLVVTGTVLDDGGRPVAGAEVRIPGWNVGTRTASDGTYRLSSFGTGTPVAIQRIDVTLQREMLGLSIKATDASAFSAVAADGVSRVSIAVTSHGIRPETVSVAAPSLGEFERASASASPLTLGQDGSGTLVYIPPRSLSEAVLTDTLTVGSGATSRQIPAATVPIVVRYSDPQGSPQTATLSLKVCRPPVLLVQSHLGGNASWTPFASYAKTRGLDCVVVGEGVTWEVGGGSLTDWAKDLARNIADAESTYETAGIKLGAVEIVAHSAAGLVARSLLEGASPRQDVGRLILLGAPNHGIAWLDQEVAAAAALWLAGHPAAASDLSEGSAFLRKLVSSGRTRNAEYVNLVGARASSLSSAGQAPPAARDDGIVSVASAHLEGVPEVRFDGVVHAPGLPLQGTPLTESRDVWTKLAEILLGEVPDAPSDALRVELKRGSQVGLNLGSQSSAWTTSTQFPVTLGAGVAVRTGDKGYAAISLSRSDETWGSISLDAKTEIVLHASSPGLVHVEVVSGRARFRSLGDGGEFEVVLSAPASSSPWYTRQPAARTLGVDGDYVVAREGTDVILALSKAIVVEYSKGAGYSPARVVAGGKGVRAISQDVIEDEAVPTHGWWAAGVWREPIPFFEYPPWLMGLSLCGAALAVVYYVRARRRGARAADRKPAAPPPGETP